MLFVNLAVNDLPASKAFFQALGYSFDSRFEDESSACLVIEEGHVASMLMTRDRFAGFAQVPAVAPMREREVLLCLSQPSREAVDALFEKALAAGAKVHHEAQDHGFMYGRAFTDLDGHGWEVMWMDVAQFSAKPA